MPLQAKKKEKKHVTTSAAPLAAYLIAKEVHRKDFAEWLGVSPGILGRWLKAGEMPLYAGRAVEALVAQEPAAQPKTIIVKGTGAQLQHVENLCQALDLLTLEIAH